METSDAATFSLCGSGRCSHVRGDNNQRARFYSLTRAGRKQLRVEEENWERLAAAVFKVMQAT